MTEAQRRKDEEALLFSLLLLLARDTEHRLTEIVNAYLSDTTNTFWRLSDSLVAALGDAHAHSAYLGRRLARKRDPFGAGDQMFAASVMAGQAQYLQGLLADLQARRYGDSLSAALANRLRLYAVRLRGTANEAWVMNLPGDTMLEWVLGLPETNHCQTCPERAANSPYAAGSVSFQPGDGSSECGVLCLCDWQIVGTSQGGFPPLNL